MTSDKEFLETISGMTIALTSGISHRHCVQYSFNDTKSKFIEEELQIKNWGICILNIFNG